MPAGFDSFTPVYENTRFDFFNTIGREADIPFDFRTLASIGHVIESPQLNAAQMAPAGVISGAEGSGVARRCSARSQFMTKSAKRTQTTGAPNPNSKQATLVAMLTRGAGSTLDQMVEATGWLRHTTRAALTGLKKRGYEITSQKVEGVRTYRARAPEMGVS